MKTSRFLLAAAFAAITFTFNACGSDGSPNNSTPSSSSGNSLRECTGAFNPDNKFCYDGEIYDKCDGMEYNPATHICSGGITNPAICNNGTAYNPLIQDCSGTFTDSRDSKPYKWVEIGTQTWMAENLNYNATGSVCYAESSTNCVKYGRLYNWATAMNACPSGWHLPSNAEWNVLMKFINPSCSDNADCAGAGTKLKATSGWNTNGIPGTDNFGFSALPGGLGYSDGYFGNVGSYGSWWSASEGSSASAYSRYMGYSNEGANYHYDDKGSLFSVRCLSEPRYPR